MRKLNLALFILTLMALQAAWTPSAMAQGGYDDQVANFCNEGGDPVMGNCNFCHTQGYNGCPGSNCSPEQDAFLAGDFCSFCPTNSKCQASGCTDADCDDGRFCNGVETCGSGGNCQPGTDPCAPDQACDNINGCMAGPECTTDAECDNGKFCDGVETCDTNNNCQQGTNPCAADETCDGVDGCLSSPIDGSNIPGDHTDDEEGALHKPGKGNPFDNGCTACHGSELTGPASGGFAPSCFTCHGPEWAEDDHDDDDDDDRLDKKEKKKKKKGKKNKKGKKKKKRNHSHDD